MFELAAIICFIVAPFIFLAIQGAIGLIIAAVIALIAINLAPWFGDLLANWRLKLIKAEAARNPVETLQNDYMAKQDALKKFANAITTFATEIKNFTDKMNSFKQQWGETEAKTFAEQREKMNQLLTLRRRKYAEAEKALQTYSLEIKKAESIWEMGKAANRMNKAAGMTDDDFLARIKKDTAMDAVTSSMNRAFAELETSLMEEGKERVDNILSQVAVPVEGKTA